MENSINELTDGQLQSFFCMKKTEISLIDEPLILLNQLRDNYILPEDKYQGILNTSEKKEKIISIYTFLCRLDKKPKKIRRFWELVFEDDIMKFYPELGKLKDTIFEAFKNDCSQNTHAGNEETEMISGINGIPNDQLLVFFHKKKSAISLIDEPHILLNQLRDHSFISEDIYQDIIDTTNKKKRVLAIYKFLDGLERTEPKKIRHFWEALFEDAVVRYYPKLQNLKDELLQGNCTQSPHMQIVEIQITDVRHIDNNEELTNSDRSLASSPALIIPSLTDSDEEASNSSHFNPHSQEPRASREHSDSETPNISRQSAGSSAVKNISHKRSFFDDEEASNGFHSCSRDQEISPVLQQSDSETPNVGRQSLRSTVAKRIKLKYSAETESDDEVSNADSDDEASNSGDDLKKKPKRYGRVFDSDSESDTPAIGKHSLRSSAVKRSTSKRSGRNLYPK
ncbi:uncharacterized protein LOC120538130 [Polypterus senegalus]|uniref:uncharacterized protein LOC120538130 n=1 Tax=Polypterus senegalus TaxID=55291 RepID=UPI0019662DF6|nr:uncharacterized protein LOC120538130 [Polypterus senegalus]